MNTTVIVYSGLRENTARAHLSDGRYLCSPVFTEKDYLGFAEHKDSDEIGGWQVGLEVVDFAYGAS